MFIDFWTLILIFLIFCLIVGAGVKYIVKPNIEKSARLKRDDLYSEVLNLQKQIGDIAGAEKAEQTYKRERYQNVAMMKVRALVLNFTRWEKPSRQFRIYMSFGTAILITLALFSYIRHIDDTEHFDFWAIGVLMFMFAYFFWGSVVETYWKQRQLGRLRREFLKVLELSNNPLAARDDMYKWMEEHKDVGEPVRKLLEGLFDKWLRQDLRME